MTESQKHRGSCLCGAVAFEISGAMRDVVNCHCSQCRRAHGHYAAYSAIDRGQIFFVQDEGLVWYESSHHARRGFCQKCGSSLFWDKKASETLCVAAGSLNTPTGLISTRHIFTEDAGDYYNIDDDLKRFPGSMNNG